MYNKTKSTRRPGERDSRDRGASSEKPASRYSKATMGRPKKSASYEDYLREKESKGPKGSFKKDTRSQRPSRGPKPVKKNFTEARRPEEMDEENKLDQIWDKKAEDAGFVTICGRNAVREAIKNERNILRLYVVDYEEDHVLYDLVKKAEKQGIFTTKVPKQKIDKMVENQVHQGICAVCSPKEFVDIDDLFEEAASKNEKPFFVLLDGLTDPHNVGAIIRSAYLLGAHGLIIGKRRSALIGAGVYKASAGAVEYLPICQVSNVNNAAMELQKKGVFLVGLDMDGKNYDKIDYDMPVCLVVGSEGDGMSNIMQSRCDIIASIPIKGEVDSLNASVAAGIMIAKVASSRK